MPLHFAPVEQSVTWTTLLVALLNVLVGGLLVAIVKSRPALKKIAVDREANLLSERADEMKDMRERIDKLEAALEAKDEQHAEAIRQHEQLMVAKDKLHEAQKAADRHRMNNLNMAFQSLLMLLKKGVPVEDAVSEIEAMRTQQLGREAIEAAAIRSAAIKAGLETPE